MCPGSTQGASECLGDRKRDKAELWSSGELFSLSPSMESSLMPLSLVLSDTWVFWSHLPSSGPEIHSLQCAWGVLPLHTWRQRTELRCGKKKQNKAPDKCMSGTGSFGGGLLEVEFKVSEEKEHIHLYLRILKSICVPQSTSGFRDSCYWWESGWLPCTFQKLPLFSDCNSLWGKNPGLILSTFPLLLPFLPFPYSGLAHYLQHREDAQWMFDELMK